MAFKPGKNQKYHLAVKKKGKVLGVKEAKQGITIQLVDYAANDAKQVFCFDPGEGFYWFRFPDFDRYATVHGALQDANTPVIFWVWEAGRHHNMFAFIPATNGYYRIMARHSGKYLEVVENTDRTVRLVQNELKDSDNQLFYPVLLPDKDTARPPVFYSEQSDLQRTIYLALIGQIPEAGAALSFIVGYFWKEKDKLGDFWEMMKNYVDVRIRQLIKESEIQFLKDGFAGDLDVLVLILLSPEKKKGERIRSLLDKMIGDTHHYTDKCVEVLPLLVAYGTVIIVLHKTIFDNWNELYRDAETLEIKAANLIALASSIDTFSKAVNTSRTEYMKWRLDQIPDSKTISPSGVEQAVMTDSYDGVSLSWLAPRYSGGSHDFEYRAAFFTEQKRAIARVQFDLQLDELTRAAHFWKYFNPLVPFIPTKTHKTVGSFGGIVYSPKLFYMDDAATFDRIDFFAKNGSLCGLELFWQNRSYGLLGSNGTQKTSLVLEKGEFVNSVFGYAKDWVSSLWMTTTKGRKAGVGGYGDPNSYFIADLPDSFQARLHGMNGMYNDIYRDNLVFLLSFRWEYDDYK